MTQLILHLIGDYVLQSHWMAAQKIKFFLPAAVHALIYAACFLVLRPSVVAWLVILVTHFLIDRYRLARYVVWTKNWMGPQRSRSWRVSAGTGFPPEVADFLAVWLLIIVDNTVHLTINYAALRWL